MDVKCKDIHYSIGEKKILNSVSLEVEGGQFQTILEIGRASCRERV